MTWGRGRLAVAAATAALLLAACSAAALDQGSEAGGAPPASTANRGGADAARNFRSERDYQGTPAPVRIDIPRIGIASRLTELGKARDGTVEVPADFAVPGWYAQGPRPGDAGSAVILGHVDNKTGPAVFFRLRELKAGDEIRVTRADSSVVRFGVDRTEQFLKTRFPTEQVYYPTLTPELRLITCGGTFDDTTGHYRSNIIVFARLER